MPSCSLKHCSSRRTKNQPQLSVHRLGAVFHQNYGSIVLFRYLNFPKSNVLRGKWLKAIGEENINTRHKELRLCSLHFDESQLNRTLKIVRLCDNAVPTLFLRVYSIILSICMLLGIAGGAMIVNNSDNREEKRMAENLIDMFMTGLLYYQRMIVFIGVLLMVKPHKIKRNVVRVYLITAACFYLLDFSMLFVGLVQELSVRTVVLSVSILGVEAHSFLDVRSYYYKMEPTHIITV